MNCMFGSEQVHQRPFPPQKEPYTQTIAGNCRFSICFNALDVRFGFSCLPFLGVSRSVEYPAKPQGPYTPFESLQAGEAPSGAGVTELQIRPSAGWRFWVGGRCGE